MQGVKTGKIMKHETSSREHKPCRGVSSRISMEIWDFKIAVSMWKYLIKCYNGPDFQ
jgi:hypothetical protein